MNIFEIVMRIITNGHLPPEMTRAQRLYAELSANRDAFSKNPFSIKDDPEEGVSIISETIYGWWKQRYVMNHRNKTAFEFIDRNKNLVAVTYDDIDWHSLEGLPEKAISRAKYLSAVYPTMIYGFKDGISVVEWQLNPDGRYFRDEDGYGMTDDEEISIKGKIDVNGHIVQKFHYTP